MRTWIILCITLVSFVPMFGCGQISSEQADVVSNEKTLNGVAVIDLDAIAKRLGKDVDIANDLKNESALLQNQIVNAKATFEKQLNTKKSEYGEKPDETQTKEFVGLKKEATARLLKAQQDAQQVLNTKRSQLISRFREEVKPIALKVAKSKGLGVVVTKNDNLLLTFDETTDITDEVMAELVKSAPVKAAPEVSASTIPASQVGVQETAHVPNGTAQR